MDKEKLKKAGDYTIILIVFAVTGSTAAIIPRYLMPVLGLECCNFWYVFTYIMVITPIYQVLLLIYAFIFGKFSYFYEKEKKIFRWMTGWMRKKPAEKTPG
ncbi:MAG: DUF6787 family protein [Bacteroidia bacterium]